MCRLILVVEYADSATREKTTIGVITYIGGGRHSSYYYEFEINGVKLYDETGSCRTALTPKGCKVGAPVLVYYDYHPTLETKLEEFGAVSRGDLLLGVWMISGGFLLIALHFVFRRALKSPDESDESETMNLSDGQEAIHVVPDK
jgi:hypothetical protein